MARISVVFPAPFAPTSATLAPSPTRKETSSSKILPSGRSKRTPATSTWPMGGLSLPCERHANGYRAHQVAANPRVQPEGCEPAAGPALGLLS